MIDKELRDIMNEVSTISNSLEDKIDKKSQDVSLNNIETKHLMISNMGDIIDLLSLVSQSHDGRMSKEDKKKLDGIEAGSNKYVHPATHPATMITTDSEHRFVTDTMINSWNNKFDKTGGDITGDVFISKAVNTDSMFGLYEDNKKHGFYIKYLGASSHDAVFGMKTYEGLEKDAFTINRESQVVNFKKNPTLNGELLWSQVSDTAHDAGSKGLLHKNTGIWLRGDNEINFSSGNQHLFLNYRQMGQSRIENIYFGNGVPGEGRSAANVYLGKLFSNSAKMTNIEVTGTGYIGAIKLTTEAGICGTNSGDNANVNIIRRLDNSNGKLIEIGDQVRKSLIYLQGEVQVFGENIKVGRNQNTVYHSGNAKVLPPLESADNKRYLRNDGKWNTITPNDIGAYTKSEIDSKFSQLNSGIDWKEAVNTFADLATTYPHPEDGWTVNVKDTDYTYRYTGSEWVAISANAIPNATSSKDGKMSKEDKAKLDTIERNANHYVHPSNHPASMITTDNEHMFVTKAQIDSWNAKADAAGGSVDSANKWKTARTITLTGDASGSVSIDGSQNVNLPVTILDNSHNHTWDNITGKPSTFPPSNHGNHVPDPQSPDNAIFLRNDNTWQRVTPEAIGALPTTGGNLTGPLKFNNGNSEIYQFIGFRGANNDLNARLSSEQMSWSYTGTEDSTQITHGFPMRHNANGILTFNTHARLYGHQIGLSSNGNMYHRLIDDSSFGNWYQILTSKDGKLLPELESANNARFLRNDGTWQTVTPGNIGALPSTNPKISVLPNQYYLGYSNPTFGINMGNSDLIGLNNVIFNDISDKTNENVIAWPKTNSAGTSVSNYDILRSKGNGQLLFNEKEVAVSDPDRKEVKFLYRQTIRVEGDANTYYPVHAMISPRYWAKKSKLILSRLFNEDAPPTWYTPTHKGGLVIDMDLYLEGWGGMNYCMDFWFSQEYSKICANIVMLGPATDTLVFMLRGGGAVYHIESDFPVNFEVTLGRFDNTRISGSNTYEGHIDPTTQVQPLFDSTDISFFFESTPHFYGGLYPGSSNGGYKSAYMNNYENKGQLWTESLRVTNESFIGFKKCIRVLNSDNSDRIIIGTDGDSWNNQYIHLGWSDNRTPVKVFGNLTSDGELRGSKVYNAVWNDYAEYFPKYTSTTTEPGDIIALDMNAETEVYTLASKENSTVVGVHSDECAHLIGGENPPEDWKGTYEEFNNTKYIPVGLAGRVRVKITGPISKGSKVVLSDIPGVGREYAKGADDPIDIIGTTVENKTTDSIERVKIVIK